MYTATISKNRVLAIVSWWKLNFKKYVSALLLWLVVKFADKSLMLACAIIIDQRQDTQLTSRVMDAPVSRFKFVNSLSVILGQ